MHMCGLCHCINLAGASVFVSVCCGLLRSDGIFTCHGVFSMSWRFMFCLHIMACLFTCHGGSYFVYMSWWFMLFMCHVFFSCHGSSCCSCVMVFFMPWRFMLFMCQVFCSCHGGSCCSCVMVFLKSHGGSCSVYMSWWFMLFMCHLFFSCHGSSCCSCVMVFFHVMAVHVHVPSCFVHVVVVHVVHLSRCFLKS
jgi:hypothetical protein